MDIYKLKPLLVELVGEMERQVPYSAALVTIMDPNFKTE